VKVTAERVPESKVLLRIEVPPEQVEQAIEKTFRDLSRRVKIPGFRPGKAPRSLIEKYLGGMESVQREGVDRAIDDSFREALRETDTRPIGDPDISERPEFHPGEPLVYEATVPVGPRVELGDYASVRLQRPPAVDVTADQVTRFIDELRASNATVTPVDRGAQDGDRVTIDVLGVVDATPTLFGPSGETILLTEGGREVFNVKAHDHGIDVQGPIEFAPGFDEELIGMTADSEKRFGLTLPLDYADPELAKKSIIFTVKMYDVRERHLAELDNDLATTLAGVSTVEELRFLIQLQLKSRLEREARTSYENSVLDAVVSRSTIEVPEAMVEGQIDGTIAELKADLTRAKLLWQDYLDRSQTTEAKIRAEMREPSLKTLRGFLVMREIARSEHIHVTPSEINSEIDRAAAIFGRASKVVRERLATRDERDKIESRLANAKIIARLVEIAEQPEQPTTEIDVLTESESPESPVEETVAVDAIDETVANPSAISSSDEPAESATTEE
jgi:trigger factor